MDRFKNACVVGAGTMGHGIAYILAKAGIDVCIVDNNQATIDLALRQIEKIISSGIRKSYLTQRDSEKIIKRLKVSTTLDSLGGSNLVIEAVSEDLDLKKTIFSAADTLAEEGALLATNTSSLSVAKIADVVVQKDRVLGIHFFNPPHIMKLLEIVVHKEVSDDAVESAKILAGMLQKECIVVNDSPGFATSRLGISFALEAMRMLESGVAGITELDAAMKLGYGHPMGPLMLSDWVGLDIRLAISEHLYRELGSAVFAPPNILRQMVRAGFLGKKSGTGFYEWDGNRHLGASHASLDLGNFAFKQ